MTDLKEKQAEQNHLTHVYQELTYKKEQLEQFLEHSYQQGRADLQNMSGEVALNFDNISDNLDTFAALEAQNRAIDQLNISVQTAEKELAKIKRLLPSAYFGKVNLNFSDDEPADIYIGINGFTAQGENLIYDWRSPVAELFYNNALGPASYQVNQAEINVEILKRRQLIVAKAKLNAFFDTTIAIQDDVLLATLENNSSEKMQDITASIQQEQNQIIRDVKNDTLLVQGVAGSGKTSVIMQRIAYLLYRQRDQISADDLLILSPNTQFIDYISEVLPNLGEKNPRNVTLQQLYRMFLPQDIALEDEVTYFQRITETRVTEQTKNLREAPFMVFLEEKAQEINPASPIFKDIYYRKKVIISKEEILTLFLKTPNTTLLERIQATKKGLLANWQLRLKKNARSAKLQAQLSGLSEEQQQKYFGHLIEDDSPKSLEKYSAELLQKKYRQVLRQLETMTWVDSHALLAKLYQEFYAVVYQPSAALSLDETTYYLMVRQLFIEKITVAKVKYLLVDEVQDYTPAQIFLLSLLFEKSELTLVGDDNQAIFNSQISFQALSKILQTRRRDVTLYRLFNSYRSSGVITKLFARLAPDIHISSIRPEGSPVKWLPYHSPNDFKHQVLALLTSQPQLTLLTKTQQEARELTQLFEETAVTILPISYAKGLEFDHVLLYNASADNFSSAMDRKILYTAISRATQTITLSYQENLTTLLD